MIKNSSQHIATPLRRVKAEWTRQASREAKPSRAATTAEIVETCALLVPNGCVATPTPAGTLFSEKQHLKILKTNIGIEKAKRYTCNKNRSHHHHHHLHHLNQRINGLLCLFWRQVHVGNYIRPMDDLRDRPVLNEACRLAHSRGDPSVSVYRGLTLVPEILSRPSHI